MERVEDKLTIDLLYYLLFIHRCTTAVEHVLCDVLFIYLAMSFRHTKVPTRVSRSALPLEDLRFHDVIQRRRLEALTLSLVKRILSNILLARTS